jgi:hypothetical protein
MRERGNVLGAFAEGGSSNGEDAQPEVQILPEGSVCHHRGKIAVGGGNDPDVEGDPTAFASKPLDLAILEDIQQSRLTRQGKLADFVQQEGSRVGGFEFAFALPVGAGEGPAFVAEEFALHKAFGDCTAIDDNERSVGATAEAVNCPGGEAFACAAFAVDEDGPIAFGSFAEGT